MPSPAEPPLRPGHRVRPSRRGAFAGRFVVSTVLLFVLGVTWGLSSPVPSGPDEPAQIIKAAGEAHGILIGTTKAATRSKATASVVVPQTLVDMLVAIGIPPCTYGKVDQAVCSYRIVSDTHLTTATTYEARYPPLYYALAGIPWLFTSTPAALRWMRVITAAVVALLLGLAFATVSAYSRSGLLTAATGLVVTPTVLYLAGVVNPSGMEIAGGITVWVALVVGVFHRSEDPPRPLLAALVIGSVGLCASRPLSTLWLALAMVSVLLLRPRASLRFLSHLRARIAVALSLLVALVSGIYVLLARSYEIEAFSSRASTTSGYLLAIAGHSTKVLDEVVGMFGVPDFTVPLPVILGWVLCCGGLILAAVLGLGGRDGLVLAGLTLVFGFLLPFAIIYSHVRVDGVIWQGRYSLPLIAGLPLLAAALLHDRRPTRTAAVSRVVVVMVAVWAVGCAAAYYWLLRRYTIGLGFYATNVFKFAPGDWAPPYSPRLLVGVTAAATVLFAVWLGRQSLAVPGGRHAPPDAGAPADDEDGAGERTRTSTPFGTRT